MIGSFPLKAQLSDWDFGGYVKDLVTYTDGTYEELPIEIGKWQNTQKYILLQYL